MIGVPEVLAVVLVGIILASWAWALHWAWRCALALVDRLRGRRDGIDEHPHQGGSW